MRDTSPFSLPFQPPLVPAVMLGRRKRFLADVRLPDGTLTTAHLANSGSMKNCWEVGCPVVLTDHGPDSGRKLRYTVQATRLGSGWISVNTMNPNRFVQQALAAGLFPWARGRAWFRPEFSPAGMDSRFDVVLWGKTCGKPHRTKDSPSPLGATLLEIKSVSLSDGDGARFPDAVTERGQKHLRHLMAALDQGWQSHLLFFVGLPQPRWFSPADDIDPEYGRLLRQARKKGVGISASHVAVSPDGLTLGEELPLRF